MNALEFWDDGSGNHFYFRQFAFDKKLGIATKTAALSFSAIPNKD